MWSHVFNLKSNKNQTKIIGNLNTIVGNLKTNIIGNNLICVCLR